MEADLAPGMRAGGMSRMPMIAWAVTDLPEPDSPSTASVSPAVDGVADAVDGLDDALAGVELHVQVVDVEQRTRCPRSPAGNSSSDVCSLASLTAASGRGRRVRRRPA